MPRKKGAAAKEESSEISKMLSETKSLAKRTEYIVSLRDMEEELRPKLDDGAAKALHNLLETVAEKGLHAEMRAVMQVIYGYALTADAANSTQSSRYITEGDFGKSVSRAFAMVSPRVLQSAPEPEDPSAKRPLSVLLKLVTYVAEDDLEANETLGTEMLNAVFEQWIKNPRDEPRDADIQALVLEFLAVLFSKSERNTSTFLTPINEGHEKIGAILDFAVGEGARSAVNCRLAVGVLTGLARALQPETGAIQLSQPSNPIVDEMARWLEETITESASVTCEELIDDFRELLAAPDEETQNSEGKKAQFAFCSKLLQATGRKAVTFFPSKEISCGENEFTLEEGFHVSDSCISMLVKQGDDDDEEEEGETASEAVHIEGKNIKSCKGCGHASVCLQLKNLLVSYHEDDEDAPSVVLHFQSASDKSTFLSLSLATQGGNAAATEEDPIMSQDSFMRCDIAVMDHEGRIVTPMPRNNQRDVPVEDPNPRQPEPEVQADWFEKPAKTARPADPKTGFSIKKKSPAETATIEADKKPSKSSGVSSVSSEQAQGSKSRAKETGDDEEDPQLEEKAEADKKRKSSGVRSGKQAQGSKSRAKETGDDEEDAQPEEKVEADKKPKSSGVRSGKQAHGSKNRPKEMDEDEDAQPGEEKKPKGSKSRAKETDEERRFERVMRARGTGAAKEGAGSGVEVVRSEKEPDAGAVEKRDEPKAREEEPKEMGDDEEDAQPEEKAEADKKRKSSGVRSGKQAQGSKSCAKETGDDEGDAQPEEKAEEDKKPKSSGVRSGKQAHGSKNCAKETNDDEEDAQPVEEKVDKNKEPSSRPQRHRRVTSRYGDEASGEEEEDKEEDKESWEPPAPKNTSTSKGSTQKKPPRAPAPPKYGDLKVDELKTLLRRRSLSPAGTKADLIRKLKEDEVRVNEASALLSVAGDTGKPPRSKDARAAPSPSVLLAVPSAEHVPLAGKPPKPPAAVQRARPFNKSGERENNTKALDNKSMDASVFDFSEPSGDEAANPKRPFASKPPAKVGYGGKAGSKKTAPSRKVPLNVKASSGPAFTAADSRDSLKYVEDWIKQSPVIVDPTRKEPADGAKAGKGKSTATAGSDKLKPSRGQGKEPEKKNSSRDRKTSKSAAVNEEPESRNVSDDSGRATVGKELAMTRKTDAESKEKPSDGSTPASDPTVDSVRGVKGATTRRTKRSLLFQAPTEEASAPEQEETSFNEEVSPNEQLAGTTTGQINAAGKPEKRTGQRRDSRASRAVEKEAEMPAGSENAESKETETEVPRWPFQLDATVAVASEELVPETQSLSDEIGQDALMPVEPEANTKKSKDATRRPSTTIIEQGKNEGARRPKAKIATPPPESDEERRFERVMRARGTGAAKEGAGSGVEVVRSEKEPDAETAEKRDEPKAREEEPTEAAKPVQNRKPSRASSEKEPDVEKRDEPTRKAREEEPKEAAKPIQNRKTSRLQVENASTTEQGEGKTGSKIAPAALDDSVLSLMRTTQKEEKDGMGSEPEANVEEGSCLSLGGAKPFRHSLLEDLEEDEFSPAPLSTTPKKQLFLSAKSGKFTKASLDLSPVEKSDASPTEAKTSWESPGADEESDSFCNQDVAGVGIKRKAGVGLGSANFSSTLGATGSFSARIGQQLERLVIDMGKKKRQKLNAYYEQEQNKLTNVAKAYVDETNDSIAKLNEQHTSSKKKIQHEREKIESVRAAKNKEHKQKSIQLYHSAKELISAWESTQKRQLKRRQEFGDKGKERAKKLRANCSAELKKIESSLSSEKAAQNEDMMQLKTLIGKLFTDE